MMEGGVALTIEPSICGLTEVAAFPDPLLAPVAAGHMELASGMAGMARHMARSRKSRITALRLLPDRSH